MAEAIALLALQNYLRQIPNHGGKSARQQYKDYLIRLAQANQGKKLSGKRCKDEPCLVIAEEMAWALRQVDIEIEQEIDLIYPPSVMDYKNRKVWNNRNWQWLPKMPNIKTYDIPEPYPWLNANIPANLKGCIDTPHPSLTNLKRLSVLTYGIAHLNQTYYRVGGERHALNTKGQADYRDIIVSTDLANQCTVHSDQALGQVYTMEHVVPVHVARMLALQEVIYRSRHSNDEPATLNRYLQTQAQKNEGQQVLGGKCDRPCIALAPEFKWVFEQWPLEIDPRIQVIDIPKTSIQDSNHHSWQ